MKTTEKIIEECGYSECPPITKMRMATTMVVYGQYLIDHILTRGDGDLIYAEMDGDTHGVTAEALYDYEEWEKLKQELK